MPRQMVVIALLLLIWPSWAKASPAADPAVSYANATKSGTIGYREGYFGEGDNRLHYVETGKGPLVILYHGFPSFWYSWFDQMEALKANYRVVAVDGLGAGLSAKPVDLEPYRVATLAAQIDALARHLNGRKRFTLIGHDWGAALAFAYAQGYPKRLHAVVGMSAPPYNQFLSLVRADTEQQKRSTYMQIFRTIGLDAIKDRQLPAQIWQQSYGALIARGDLTANEGALFRAALSDPLAINGGMNWYRANMPPVSEIQPTTYWPAHNAPIKVPALLIWGEADKTFVSGFIDNFSAYAPKAEIIRLAGVNHWTPMEQPHLSNNAITDFLTRHVSRR
ncbi:MAG: alpha/beta hydrolase [Sphingomonadaceae bacterium]|nr:alpha/beta hydrolase [Sphingomonadaceae bacterium]